jgi:hypothetical protein
MKKVIIKSSFLILIFLSRLSCDSQKTSPSKKSDWTILIYMQADNNLSIFSLYNIREILAAHSNNKVNTLIQWYQPEKIFTYRYKLTHQKITTLQGPLFTRDYNPELELIDSMEWAVKNFPAKHYMLVLWNHGMGILDQKTSKNRYKSIINNTQRHWLEIPGFPYSKKKRGILYSDNYNTFMTNEQLKSALNTISNTIIHKKIDIVGMDACFMAMLEVAYQIKDSTNILISSQNIEPGRGWNYKNVINYITKHKTKASPKELSKKIAEYYEDFYKNNISFYTQSIINLSKILSVKNSCDEISRLLIECININPFKMKRLLFFTRTSTIKFDLPSYLDLSNFYSNLLLAIISERKLLLQQNRNNTLINKFEFLEMKLKTGIQNIKKAVIDNVVGDNMLKAKGISIYFPNSIIHNSYNKTDFAQESSWKKLLNLLV